MVLDLSTTAPTTTEPDNDPDHLDAAQIAALQKHLDDLVRELESGLEPFKGGHPALAPQKLTLSTHELDFYLPNRVEVKVEAIVLTPLTLDNVHYELLVYREIEDDTVSYGLHNLLSVARPTQARCVILKPNRVKELFVKQDVVDDNVLVEGIRNVEVVVGLVKGFAARTH